MEHFEREEGAGAGVARIIAATCERAERQLRGGGKAMKRVHDARKRFKEIRAALRLARTGLGRNFRRANEWFRAAGRSLAPVRDLDAHVETLERLGKLAQDEATRGAIERAAEVFRAELPRIDLGEGLERLANELAARPRLTAWDFGSQRFDTIGEGLELAARKARRAFRRAAETRTAVDFHTWRRRVKDLWYQLRFLEPVNEPAMKERTAKLKELSRVLGDHHDLATLRDALECGGAASALERTAGAQQQRSSHAFESGGTASALHTLIRSELAQLERRALALGAEIHAEKPKRLRAHVQRDWEVSGSSRSETESSARTSERSSTPGGR